eukprot:jgi/Tetstr1/422920/TSEL_013701.t1
MWRGKVPAPTPPTLSYSCKKSLKAFLLAAPMSPPPVIIRCPKILPDQAAANAPRVVLWPPWLRANTHGTPPVAFDAVDFAVPVQHSACVAEMARVKKAQQARKEAEKKAYSKMFG